jgi:hypothetical protein
VRPTRRGLMALGAIAALPASARAQPAPDVSVLEELLVLEARLEAAYEAAMRRGVIPRAIGQRLRDQEHEHALGLRRALSARGRGAARGPRPDPALTGALRTRAAFGRYALTLEARALSAYVRAVVGVRDAGLRQPLGAIMTSEAQHEVALREWLGAPLLEV